MVLIALLSAWVASRGAGTLTPVRLKITLAAVPQRAYTVKAADATGAAYTYLSIRNLTSTPDELVAVRTPVASRVLLTERTGLAGKQVAVHGLAIPGAAPGDALHGRGRPRHQRIHSRIWLIGDDDLLTVRGQGAGLPHAITRQPAQHHDPRRRITAAYLTERPGGQARSRFACARAPVKTM